MATLRAWFRDDSEENLEELHQTNPPQMVTVEQLLRETAVKYQRMEDCNDEEAQRKLSDGYNSTDFLDVSRQALGDTYDNLLKMSYSEHMHEDPEIRLVLAGSGFFEVRCYDDRWIRLHVKTGDLIQLPAGIYHRFTFDSNKHIKLFRLYSEIPRWKAFFRPDADSHPARIRYMSTRPTAMAETS